MLQKAPMMNTSQPPATIRPCLYRDLDRIIPIYNHYISNTIMSLDLDTKPLLYMQKLYNSVLDQDLPFLVVTAQQQRRYRSQQTGIPGLRIRALLPPATCLRRYCRSPHLPWAKRHRSRAWEEYAERSDGYAESGGPRCRPGSRYQRSAGVCPCG